MIINFLIIIQERMIKAEKEDELQCVISEFYEEIENDVDQVVREAKQEKHQKTENLYSEFLNYMKELEKNQLLEIDGFSLRDTVGYQKVIDRESFREIKTEIKEKKNEQSKEDYVKEKQKQEEGKAKYYYVAWNGEVKKHGLKLFFGKIKAKKDAKNEYKEYIEVSYISTKEIDKITNAVISAFSKSLDDVKENYANDIDNLKEETKRRIDQVMKLIEEYDQKIEEIKREAVTIASDEDQYRKCIEQLETENKCLEQVRTIINNKYIA